MTRTLLEQVAETLKDMCESAGRHRCLLSTQKEGKKTKTRKIEKTVEVLCFNQSHDFAFLETGEENAKIKLNVAAKEKRVI